MTNKIDLDNERYDRNARDMHRARRRMLGKLVQIRRDRDHSQVDVANAVGVNRSTVSRFEHELENSNPTLDTVLRYAHAVGAKLTLEVESLDEPTQCRGKETPVYEGLLSAVSEALNESYLNYQDVDLAWADAGKHVQPLNT